MENVIGPSTNADVQQPLTSISAPVISQDRGVASSSSINVEPSIAATAAAESQEPSRFFRFFRKSQSSAAGGRGPPPTYEEANDPNAPPPSYDSLFGRVREVRKSSTGIWDFMKNLFFYMLGKIGLMMVVGISIVVPVCMLVIGSVYVNECPAEDYIPIYLIVGGVFGLLKQIIALKIPSRRSRQAEIEVPDSSFTASLQSLINSFLICWFITGCYWVYGAYEPNYVESSEHDYCNQVVYGFAFWLLTSTYIFIAVGILLLCCISSTSYLLTSRND